MSAPVVAAPARIGAIAAAPQAAPQLPSTGTGGLLGQPTTSSGLAGLLVDVFALLTLGLGATGALAYRRAR